MKLTDLVKARNIQSELSALEEIELKAMGYPRPTARMEVDGHIKSLILTHAEADSVIMRRRKELEKAASDIGLELGE